MRRTTANNSGMTLLEVVLGIGIFSIIKVAFLQVLMSVHRTNNTVAASMTASAAIRSLADEAIATAAEEAKADDLNYATAFLQHYRDILNDSGENFNLPIGPNGANLPRVQVQFMGTNPVLVHHFPVPAPGSFSRYTTTAWSNGGAVGEVIPYQYGVGIMYIYANENFILGNGMAGGTLTGEDPLTANGVPVDMGGIPITWETNGERPAAVTDGSTNGYFNNSPGDIDNYIMNPGYPAPAGLNRVFADIDPTSKQWWEREENEGLSGKASHPAIGVNMQEDGDGKTDEEIRRDHFDRFGINPTGDEKLLEKNVWTMQAVGTDEIIDFPRASFEYEPYGIEGEKKRNTGRLDADDPIVAKFLTLAQEGKTVGGKAVFYYTRGDLVDYMQYFVSDNAPGYIFEDEMAKWYDGEDWRYLLAEYEFENVHNTGLGVPVDFRPIDERWIDTDKDNALRTERATLEASSGSTPQAGDLDSMIVSREPVSVRKLAADLVGSSVESVPLIRTKDFSALSGAAAEATTLGFIAGEIRNKAGNDMMANGIIADGGGVPVRGDKLTFPELIDDIGTHRTGNAVGFFEPMPSDPTDKAALDAAAKKVVALCYADFFNGQVDPTDTSLQRDVYAKQDVQDAYGIKEERHSIGFHRTGKEFDLRRDNAQDRTEIVVLGLNGFNPYRTTPYSPSFIANEQSGPDEDPSYAVRANYDADGGVAPTFVFDKPIDGAGALIVNGNLHIKSTFAYYGVLIVLGDIIIEPSLHEDQFVYNANGHAVDAWGNALRRLSPNATEWQYEDMKNPQLDDEGNVIGNPVPALQDVYRGELVVQGLVAAKGRIITEQVAKEPERRLHPSRSHPRRLAGRVHHRTDVYAAGERHDHGEPREHGNEHVPRGSVLATGVHGGRQYITRQYQSFIELRNMTIE